MKPNRERQFLLLATSLGAAFLATVVAVAAEPASVPAETPKPAPAVDQHGPTIKDTYEGHFLIGMAGDLPGFYSDVERRLAKEHFHIVTPENCMKPALVHPSEDTWRFERRQKKHA